MDSPSQRNSENGESRRATRWKLPLSDSRSRAAAWLLVALYLAGLAVSASMRSQSDFIIYRNAGIHALHRMPIYDFHDPSPFQYAPAYAVAFIPFARLPLRPAQLLWFLVSVAVALPALIVGTGRLLFGSRFELRGEVIIVPLLLCVPFIESNFDHGQINLLLTAMIVWGMSCGTESKTMASGVLMAAASLAKPYAAPAMLYLLCAQRLRFMISLLVFMILLLWLPAVFADTGYALHETTEYLRSLTIRVPHLSHDLYNKYNQSAAAIAVRLFATKRDLLRQRVAAIAGFVFQVVLSIAVIVWLLRRHRDARPSLAALFCPMAAFSPVSWLEYYITLFVPYMALTFIACSDSDEHRWRARMAQIVLGGVLVLNLGARLFQPFLYYGVEYFSSLAVLAAIVTLTGNG
jgi:glycosyl transferase family 87